MDQTCENCGQGVLVQIQKNTGFCTPKCQEEWERKNGDPWPGDPV